MATFVATIATPTSTTSPWPGSVAARITSPRDSDLRREIENTNLFMSQFAAMLAMMGSDSAVTTSTPSRGTTVTVATSSSIITIAGVPVLVAATTAQAFGALGTIAASKWGVIAIDAVASGTISFAVSANYATGFATEALAIADAMTNNVKTANKARIGYVTVLASASTWITGTDALAGGTGGNPATATNYYGVLGYTDTLFWTAKQVANLQGTVLSATAGN